MSYATVMTAMSVLTPFLGMGQSFALFEACRGCERQEFINKITEMANCITNMPKIYEQDGKGEEAVAYLHYFRGGMDWYITEKDTEAEQHQAYGYADLGYGSEMGYISLVELTKHNVELDLYFTPKTIKQIKEGR